MRLRSIVVALICRNEIAQITAVRSQVRFHVRQDAAIRRFEELTTLTFSSMHLGSPACQQFITMAPITLGIALFAALSAAQSLYDLGVANPSKGAKITQVPLLGLGTWAVKDNATEVVASAIASGYRHVDTATVYMNQGQIAPGIREGLKRAGLKREDIFITVRTYVRRG